MKQKRHISSTHISGVHSLEQKRVLTRRDIWPENVAVIALLAECIDMTQGNFERCKAIALNTNVAEDQFIMHFLTRYIPVNRSTGTGLHWQPKIDRRLKVSDEIFP